MLYTFKGRNGKLGFINQDGKVVAEPQYDDFRDHFFDQTGKRWMGLVVRKGLRYTIYYLDGRSIQFKEECHSFNVMEGGRYATVYPWSPYSIGDCGIYDLQQGKYVIEPKKGQSVYWSNGAIVISRNKRNWVYGLKDGTMREIPGSSDLSGSFYYFPDVGWYSFYMNSVYDKDVKEITALRGWSIGGGWNNDLFSNSEYVMIDQYHRKESILDSYREYAFVNRKGEIIPNKYDYVDFIIKNNNRGSYYLSTGTIGSFFQIVEKDGTVIWLDQNLKELGRAKAGERLIHNVTPHNLLLDAKGNVVRALDDNFKTVREDTIFRQYTDAGSDNPRQGDVLYRLKDGKWTILDLGRFIPQDYWGASPVVICDDYIIVCVEKPGSWDKIANTPTVSNMSLSANAKPSVQPMLSYYIPPDVVEVFAVDWNGKRIKNCPLALYYEGVAFDTPGSVLPDAGWQGQNYHWVEANGRRGFVNTKGEWVFIDTSK